MIKELQDQARACGESLAQYDRVGNLVVSEKKGTSIAAMRYSRKATPLSFPVFYVSCTPVFRDGQFIERVGGQ